MKVLSSSACRVKSAEKRLILASSFFLRTENCQMPRQREQRRNPRKSQLSRDAAIIWALHNKQPMNLQDLAKKTAELITVRNHDLSKSIKYDYLRYLVEERSIIKVLERDGEELCALRDYENLQASVKWAIEDFELLFCRWPSVEEIAVKIGRTPTEIEHFVYELAPEIGWELPPSEQRKKEEYVVAAQSKARMRLELAAWLDLGCRNSDYVKKQWPKEAFSKAKAIRAKRKAYMPKVQAWNYPEDSDTRLYYRLCWPTEADHIAGTSRMGEYLIVNKDHMTSLGPVRMVLKKDLGRCLDKLTIQEKQHQA